MKITRRFTQPSQDVYSTVEWTKRTSRITNADGSVVFEMKDAEVPRSWSQLATDIMVSKYFRKAGVPQTSAFSTSRDRKGAEAYDTAQSSALNECAFFVSFTTYAAWLHGDDRGSVDREHNLPGTPIILGDADRERKEFDSLKQGPMTLETEHRRAVQDAIVEVCQHRRWRLLALHVRIRHVHCVVIADQTPERVMNDFKSYATRKMRERGLIDEDRRVWTRHGSTRYLNDETSLARAAEYVVQEQGAMLDPAPVDHRGAQPLPYGRGSLDARGWSGQPVGPEKSVRQVVHRLAGCWKHWGQAHGYFDSAEDAQAFYDELAYMLLHQMAAPNSPQWFNTGLNWAYGITGPPQGHYIANSDTGEVSLAQDAYTHPQPHACFIQSVRDDLVGSGGIMDLWMREARLFKYGSGTGTNFSSLRAEGEPLSGGGTSSGLMSWLRIGDRAAGAIKSGGTTRRAAKMVCLDADHPDIEHFVNWKVREELKVAAMVEGMKRLGGDQKALAASLGLTLSYDFNGEAYYTVSGQNSNNSVRLTDAFFEAVRTDGDWHLTRRTDGKTVRTIKARDLWQQICRAAWRCADPGVQYDSTINAWHTCANSGRINASNPCSEYMFLDDTACNLASINLLRFYDAEQRQFDTDGYEHAINLWTIVLEISVLMASFPSEEIARKSWRYRTLGLGYANLGAMLMQAGIPYDSDDARAICGALTAILTGRSYAMSAQMAAELRPFPGFADNREAMLRVIRNHRRAAYGVPRDSDAYEGLSIKPVPIDHELFATRADRLSIANAAQLLQRATRSWDEALEFGQRHGYRNAQVTVIAPTGTIGLLMDCDTTGVEPDFALVKFKKLAGGGYFKIANASLRPALKSLGYDGQQIDDIVTYVMGTLSLDTPLESTRRIAGGASEADDGPSRYRTLRDYLKARGFNSAELVALENQLPTVFELKFAFSAWSMPPRVLKQLGIDPERARNDASFNGLKALGMTSRQIDELNRIICGTQTVEGAPHLKPEHLAVFDCANKCGATGARYIAPQGHIRMMAASQPFISGAISKTINLPHEATEQDIADAYWLSWELGLKANALYRDGSKLSQPLSTKSDAEPQDDGDENAQQVEARLGEASTAVAEAARAISTSSASFASAAGPEALIERQLKAAAAIEAVPTFVERIVERIIERPMRRRLPDTRKSLTHHFNVAGHEGYLTVGMYDDGSPGELFITMSKEGSTIGGLMDSLGTAISVALQYGVPIESLVNKFAHQRFEPMGMTTNRDVPFAKSLVDYIFRWMGMEFIPGYREANAPNRSQGAKKSALFEEAAPAAQIKEDHAWSQITSGTSPPQLNQPANGISTAANRLNGHGGDRMTSPADAERTGDPSPRTPSNGPSAAAHVIVAAHTERSSRSSTLVLESAATLMVNPLDHANAALMGDAPACDKCGAITVRNGSCYRCLNCGQSMGCS